MNFLKKLRPFTVLREPAYQKSDTRFYVATNISVQFFFSCEAFNMVWLLLPQNLFQRWCDNTNWVGQLSKVSQPFVNAFYCSSYTSPTLTSKHKPLDREGSPPSVLDGWKKICGYLQFCWNLMFLEEEMVFLKFWFT